MDFQSNYSLFDVSPWNTIAVGKKFESPDVKFGNNNVNFGSVDASRSSAPLGGACSPPLAPWDQTLQPNQFIPPPEGGKQGFYWETGSGSPSNWPNLNFTNESSYQRSKREYDSDEALFESLQQKVQNALSVMEGKCSTKQLDLGYGLKYRLKYSQDLKQKNGLLPFPASKAVQNLVEPPPGPKRPVFNGARPKTFTNPKDPTAKYPPKKYCSLCAQNGESAAIFTSHTLKTADGKALCPVLRNYVCKICGATGDNAHTMAYCPLRKGSSHVPLALRLKSTPTDSCGRKRVQRFNNEPKYLNIPTR